MLRAIKNKKINEENIRIGLSKTFLLDLPAAQKTISSLSLLNLFRLNKIETNRDIVTVNCNILGKSSNTYEKYAVNSTLSVVSKSKCLRLCPNHNTPVSRDIVNRKLDEISLITYIVNLDIYSVIPIF